MSFGLGNLDLNFDWDRTQPITIDDMTITGVLEVSDTSGMNAPEKKTEQGFSWDSYVDTKPISVSVEALVPTHDYNRLRDLRESEEPVAASLDQVVLEEAVIDDLEVVSTSEQKSHYEVSFSMREVQVVSSDTTTLTIETGNGETSGSATAERPSFVQSESGEDSTSEAGEQVQEDGSDSGNFISDEIGNFADSIGGIF